MLSRQREHYRWAKYANASQRHNYIMLGFRCTELENNNFQTSVLRNYLGLFKLGGCCGRCCCRWYCCCCRRCCCRRCRCRRGCCCRGCCCCRRIFSTNIHLTKIPSEKNLNNITTELIKFLNSQDYLLVFPKKSKIPDFKFEV